MESGKVDGASEPDMRRKLAVILASDVAGYSRLVAAGKIAWQGSLGRELVLPFGPPGFRTDNARFAFEYFAAAAPRSRAATQQALPGRAQCVLSEGD